MNATRRACRAMLVSIVLLAAAQPSRAVDGVPIWIESKVADPVVAHYAASPKLAFDHYGRPSVSYARYSAASTGSTAYRSDLLGLGLWSHHVLETGLGVGGATGLSFDRAENPVAFWQDPGAGIKYRFANGSNQVLVATGANTSKPLIDVHHDLAGNLRGVYAGVAAGSVFAINQTGSNYNSTSLLTIPGASSIFDLGMTTDFVGLRHLAARVDMGAAGAQLFIASEPNSPGTWPAMTVPVTGEVNGMDIATDPGTGHVALAYSTFESGTNTSRLFYSAFNGIVMETTEVLSSTTGIVHDLSLDFDFSDGRPAIAYEREQTSPSPAQQLHFTWLDGSNNWQSGLVDGSISLSPPLAHLRKPSLAFDDFGTSWPAIAYVDADGSVMVAFDPPVPEPASLLLLAAPLLAVRRRR